MCTNDSIQTISMTKPVRKGFILSYKKRFLRSNWRREWVVLHEDSSLEWFKDENEDTMNGGIILKEAPEMIAAGPYANYVPNKPELPKESDPNCLMVFGTKAKDKAFWFLASNVADLNEWMTAISNTLPPPPPPPLPSAPPQPGQGGSQPRVGGHQDPPPPYYEKESTGQPRVNPAYPTAGGARGNGGMAHRAAPQAGQTMGHVCESRGGQNTVVIDRGRDGVGNFATGMMMGSAMSGWGLGFGWGVAPLVGYGFGGWGYGSGFGGYRPPYINNTEVNVYNTNNIENNTTTNNDPQGNSVSEGGLNETEGSVDPGLQEGVDPNGFQPGFEPHAETVPTGNEIYPGLDGIDPDAEILPGFGGPGSDNYNGIHPDAEFIPTDGGADQGFLGGDMQGLDRMEMMDGGMDMDMGGFDMGGFDVGGFDF